jgi:hypothetical protein
VPVPSHLAFCTPTKSKLYLDSSLETLIREPGLYKFLTFHVPTLMSIFLRLVRLSKESIQVRGLYNFFCFLWWGVVSPTANPQAGGPSIVIFPWLLIEYIHGYSPLLYAVPPSASEVSPCCGDKRAHLTCIWMTLRITVSSPCKLVFKGRLPLQAQYLQRFSYPMSLLHAEAGGSSTRTSGSVMTTPMLFPSSLNTNHFISFMHVLR